MRRGFPLLMHSEARTKKNELFAPPPLARFVTSAFFTAELIHRAGLSVTEKLKNIQFLRADFRERLPLRLIKAGIAVVIVASLMYWKPAGEHAKRATLAATQMRRAKPGDTPVAKAFAWMKAELPHYPFFLTFPLFPAKLKEIWAIRDSPVAQCVNCMCG